MMKKFTLIELVVVIAVLGILASIIIPNIANITRKGESVAITSNVRNLQTISDMYSLDNNGEIPAISPPQILMPESVDFRELYPAYERNLPKTKHAKYWIDVNGEVWGSEADSPTGYSTNGNQISWTERIGSTGYQVYEIVGYKPTTTSLKNGKVQYKPIGERITETTFVGEAGKAYAVSSIDDMGHISAPIGTGAYIEYTDVLESIKKGESSNTNRPPVAKITVSPSTVVDTETTLTWDHSQSIDPDGDPIVEAEWKNKQDKYTTEGTYFVELRVKDSAGNWSEWTSATIQVSRVNQKPIATFTYSPSTNITNATMVSFDPSTSSDADGDSIVAYEWQVDSNPVTTTIPNNMFSEGNHTVKLRVQDSRGSWSDWVSHTFNVIVPIPNDIPVAVITMTPNSNIDSNTPITWSHASSTDDKGIVAAEWQLNSNAIQTTPPNGLLSVGTHTIKLRVKDTDGEWSEWVSQTITVNAAVTISATSSDMMSISLNFNGVGTGNFKLYRNGSLHRTFASTTTSYTDTGLDPSTTYSYYITVQNDTIQSNTVSRATTSAPACPKDSQGRPNFPSPYFDGYNSGSTDQFSLHIHKCAYGTPIQLQIKHFSWGVRTQTFDMKTLSIGNSFYGPDYMLISGFSYTHPISGSVDYYARLYITSIQPYYSYIETNTRTITAN